MRDSGYDRVANDWYVEPAWVVEALLDVESFVGLTRDPSCGGGNIPLRMRARGLEAHGADIVNRGFGATEDFFVSTHRSTNIVSNPPYGVIEPFIQRALSLTSGKVVILARLAFLEGIKRQGMFRASPLARVWVSSRRVSMPPGGTDIKSAGGTIAYAWFVWEHGHKGPPTLGWLP